MTTASKALTKTELKHFSKPDEVREFSNTKIEIVNFNEISMMRATLAPNWKWSQDVKPTAGTESCLAPHTQYIISGRLMVAMDDGTQLELGPGDAAIIPPGHDAWVLGSEPCVLIDFTAAKVFGKK